jgi:hypothetical protein
MTRELTEMEMEAARALCRAQWFADDWNEASQHSTCSNHTKACSICRAYIARIIDGIFASTPRVPLSLAVTEGPIAFGHPEAICEDCGGANVSWFAPSPLWNQVVRPDGEQGDPMLCPRCFALRAFRAGVDVTWKLEPTGSSLYPTEGGERAWREMWMDVAVQRCATVHPSIARKPCDECKAYVSHPATTGTPSGQETP